MIIEVRANNCFAFDKAISFSMKSDMRNKKFASNVHKENEFNVLKVAGIYGSNNAGKTCLVRCIQAIKHMLLNKPKDILPNLFTHNKICELGITFLHNGKKYAYDFKYNAGKKVYIYERFAEIHKDEYGNESEKEWLLRDTVGNKYTCLDAALDGVISSLAGNSLLIHLIDTSKFAKMDELKTIVTAFANKIDIIRMNNIPIEKTIDLLKNHNNLQNKVVDFIKNADLYLEDFSYQEATKFKLNIDTKDKAEEHVLNLPDRVIDQICLTSVYKSIPVPSMLFDSTGTKKIAALASYIIEGLEQGRILVVDELDSGIHFKLTRAIVAMFNNELNTNAQLIFTVHDINLMDCKRLFRKEQIWFVHKDESGVYVYSLADFTAEDGVRDTTDIMEKYRKGVLGALPDPDLIRTLLDIKGNKEEQFNEQ